MSICRELTEAHVRSFRIEASEALKIIQCGKPLNAKKLQDMGGSEVYAKATFDRLEEAERGTVYPIPENVGSLVFPTWFAAPQFFCFCSSYTWSLLPDEQGLLRYYLMCNYWCIPTFQVVLE